MSWYPGSCNNDKSESVDVHVSCRQIAPKYKPCDVKLSITGNKLLNFALTLCLFNVSIKNSFGLFWNNYWTLLDFIGQINIPRVAENRYFMFGINKSWQHMIKIIFCTSKVIINLPCSFFSVYHNTNYPKGRMMTPVSQDKYTTSNIHCHASQQIRRVWTTYGKHINISYIENTSFWLSVN